MSMWTVTLKVNIPGLGEHTVDIVQVVAETLEAAIVQAYQAVVVVAIAAQQTATTPQIAP